MNAEAFKKYRIKSNPNEALIAATIGFFVGFAAVALFNVTAKNFKEAMGLDPVQVGLLVAMPMLSGSLLRIPFSAWVDTDGGRKPMLTLLGMSIVGLLGLIWLIVAYYPNNLSAGLYPLLLYYTQVYGALVKTYVLFRLDRQRWTRQNIARRAAGDRRWHEIGSTFVHTLALATLVVAIAFLTGALELPPRLPIS